MALQRRSRLKPVSAKQRAKKADASALVKQQGAAFRESIKGKRCVVCARSNGEAWNATGYGLQAHHGVGQQRLRRLGLEEHLWDPRNAVAVCEEPCHRRHTSARRRILRSELPGSVVEFARELEIEHVLEREYPDG